MPELNDLSERELEILRLVATGASNKEIAHQLTISPNTVKVHLKNIFSKIEVASRTEAAMAAVQLGVVQSQSVDEAVSAAAAASAEDGLTVNAAGTRTAPSNRSFVWLGLAALLVLAVSAGYALLSGRLAPIQTLASPPAPTDIPRWRERASLGTARFGLAVAALENQVYAIAGETKQGVSDILERYDPQANRWERLAPKPTPVADVCAAVIGGKIYVPGGRLASGELADMLEIYNPDLNEWETGAPLPAPLSAYALAAYEGKLYLFGGWDGQNFRNTVYEYDPDPGPGGKWTEKTAMSAARAWAGAAVSGAKVYVIGGMDGEDLLAVNEVYMPDRDDGSQDPWSQAASLPQGRAAMGVTSIADIIHVIGGDIPDGEAAPSLAFFPQNDEWRSFDTPQSVGSDLGLVSLAEFLYVVGGRSDADAVEQTLSYQAIYTVSIPVIVK